MGLKKSPFLIAAAAKVAFEKPGNILLFAILSIMILAVLIAVPTVTIPGNDFAHQLSLLKTSDMLLLITLASLTSLSIIFHLYIRHFKGPESDIKIAGQTGISFTFGIIASIFGTATCGVCVASIFGFLGFGAVLFLISYRFYIVGFAIILTLISLHYLSLRVLNACEECNRVAKDVKR